ncbi:hypothetical protein LTR84_011696 [Exophiala bonariae]|uniref:BZIP domain-containing protein n=1 Tax=Exophiala bonariae TaxID=1690606 RepID=A0AAV9NI89_9EURO|nr:hypothetical protein LTR84_011696 [Exophiala bonariae]
MPKAAPTPPTRSIPPVKPMKTERTHEENQERAYIAASRRSDRSLEARVESARRASEIHKRRTGRSLRVTEQDVINEEMYEEEDDDLPMHYRRLTAHLQTGSADFNRRLAAYLTQQVAVRNMMGQMQNPYAQYPNMPYQPQPPNMFQPQMLPQTAMVQSPTTSYRSAPYPNPHQTDYRQNHGRAQSLASFSNNQNHTSPPNSAQTPSLDSRRMSTPATTQSNSDAQQSGHNINTDNIKPDPDYLRQTQSATFPQSSTYPSFYQNPSPFTTSLPPESQQMLAFAPQFDINDPTYAMLMQGSDQYTSSPYYPWHDMNQSGLKGMPVHPSAYQGMSTTLAPSDLEHHVMNSAQDSKISSSLTQNAKQTSSVTHSSTLPPTAGLDFNFSQESKAFDFGNTGMSGEDSLKASGLASGQITPGGEGFWDNFMTDGTWEDEHTARSLQGSVGDDGNT